MMKIVIAILRGFFAVCFLLELGIITSFQGQILSVKNILLAGLVILLYCKHIISDIVLLLYSAIVLYLLVFPTEYLYYKIYLGLDLSSFIRLNVVNIHILVNFIMNLSLYFSVYLLLFEIPYRMIKKHKIS